MNKLINPLILFLFLLSPLFAADTELQPISFGGGVDYKTDCSQIRDDRACDSSNLVADLLGAAVKRGGSERYIDQSVSSNPVTGLFRAYASTGTIGRKALLMANRDRIYVSTTESIQNWITLSSGLPHNNHYSFTQMLGKVIISAHESTLPVKTYDLLSSSFTDLIPYASTNDFRVRGKYSINSQNYLIIGNCVDTSSIGIHYPGRIYYSQLVQMSSFTPLRYIDFKTDDGDEITGLGELFGRVHIFKQSSIFELQFSVLNLLALGGDQSVAQLVQGFGCIAPRTLANTGQFYVLLAKDGIRIWDGGRRTRLTVSEESRIISGPVEPIVNSIIQSGAYANCSGVYYPKKQWYVFSYEDPARTPAGRPNSALIYDFGNGEWYPVRNWNAEVFATFDGTLDNGELVYGDSVDGYVYYADRETSANDARKELVIDTMDSTAAASTVLWNRAVQDTVNVKEGTGSMKLTLSPTVTESSMTHMVVLRLGEWPDGSEITKADKLAFKVYVSSLANLSTIRIDLEINDITGDFDSNFTSVTVTSNALTGGNNAFSTVEIPLSSFTILSEWTDLTIESFTFANALTYYGLRFVVNSVSGCVVSFDDLRVVQASENPLNAFRLTKQFNFGTTADKLFRQVVLNLEKPQDSELNVDILRDFGGYSKTISLKSDIPKEIVVTGLNRHEGVTRMDSVDFRVLETTLTLASDYFAPRPLTVDGETLYLGDQLNHRLIKIKRSSMTDDVFVSTYGSLGSGTTNFNIIYELAQDDNNLYVCDFGNQRIKVHRKSNLEFVQAHGTLGTGATSFHNPSGVAVDDIFVYVANDGNYSISKLTKSTFGFVTSIELNLNTIGDTTLAVDDSYLYVAYNLINSKSLEHQDVILEKRNKSNLRLVNKTTLREDGGTTVSLSTYALLGDIAVSGPYVYVSFTSDINGNGRYYIQKLARSDFSIINEYSSTLRHFAVNVNGLAYKPSRQSIASDIETDGKYLQLRFYENENLDNTMKLYNMSFLVIPTPVTEQ